METCSVETGLLKKKPCGEASVTHCLNCEIALCIKHAVAQLSANGKKTGKFMCKECSVATREHDKAVAAVEKPKPAAAKPAAAPAKAGAPSAVTPAKAGAPSAVAPAKAGAGEKPKDPPADEKSGPNFGGIDFTPTKK
jgi:hypothetical protein